MRILLLTHGFNSLAQRLFVELRACGHEVSVEFDINHEITLDALERFQPDLVVAPFLKRIIPPGIFERVPCLIVHPGVEGDRGPSALDWAIQEGEAAWGVTILQAGPVIDAGDVWATRDFPVREASKGDLYRREVADAATAALLDALGRLEAGTLAPRPLDYSRPGIRGRERPVMRQADRAIDWERDDSAAVLRKLRAADSRPGLRDRIGDREWLCFGPHPEGELRGRPGEIVATRDGAICRATTDGAVWITHLADPGPRGIRLPATDALGALAGVPESEVPLAEPGRATWREIRYEEIGAVGYLYFDFYSGAMSTCQCRRLLAAYRHALARPTRVLALLGGESFWSTGIHLGAIEASDSPADESWANINAIDDLAREIICTDDRLVLAVMRGNAAAGGVFLALAADRVIARDGIVLNPHYRGMGNLYGSEYWTYLLPRRVGEARAREIALLRLPIGSREAVALGLVDEVVGDDVESAGREIAGRLAADPAHGDRVRAKQAGRRRDEARKPLESYREEELGRMRLNFYGLDPSYHVARYNFVFQVPHSRTPAAIASHRRARPRA